MKRIRTRSQYVTGDDDISPVVATNDPEKILAHKEQEVEEVDTKESIRDREAAKAREKADKAKDKDAEGEASSRKGGKKASVKKTTTKKAAAPKAAGVKKPGTKKGGKRGPKKSKGRAKASALAPEDEEEPEVPAAEATAETTAETTAEQHEAQQALAQGEAAPAAGSTSDAQHPSEDVVVTRGNEEGPGHVDDQAAVRGPQHGSDSYGGTEILDPQGEIRQTEQQREDTPAVTSAPVRIGTVTSPVQEESVTAAPTTPLPSFDGKQAGEASGDTQHALAPQTSFTDAVTAAPTTSLPSFDGNQVGKASGDTQHALAPQTSFTGANDADITAGNSLGPSAEIPLPNTTEVKGSGSIASAQDTQTMANNANTLSSGGPPSGQPAFGYSSTVFPGAYTQPRRRSRKSSKDDEDDGSKRKKSGGDEKATGVSGRAQSADPCKEYPARLQDLERRNTDFKIAAEDPAVERGFMLDETLYQAIVSVTERVTENDKGVRFAYLPPVGVATLQFPGMSKPGQQAARPGCPMIFPYSTMDHNTGRGHHSLFVVNRKGDQDFEIYHYDSANLRGHRQDFQNHVTKLKDLLRDLGWARNTELSIPETAHPSTNRIRQISSWECGLHTIFNAWAIALGLEIATGPATPVRSSQTFQRDGVRMINLARESRMDSKTIEAFLKCYGFVAADASVPADRAFEKTIPFLTSHSLNAFIDRIRLANDLEAWKRNDSSIPDKDELENALRQNGRTNSEIEFDFQDSSEAILARYRAEFQDLQPEKQYTSALGPAATSSNQVQNQEPPNEADDDAYEPEPLLGSEVNIPGTDSQLPRVASPQADDQGVSMADGRSQIAEFINRHGTPEQRQRQREATIQEQTRRSGGSPSMAGGSPSAKVADGHPPSAPPPNTAVVGTDLASGPLASIQTHLAQDAQSRQAAAASTASPTTPPNTSVLLDVMSGDRVPTPEPRTARESEAVTTVLESSAQPDPLDREERATGPPAHDPNPLTEPEEPGLNTDDDLFGEDDDGEEEAMITTSPVKATATPARNPTGLALPPQTPSQPQQTFLPGLGPSPGSSGPQPAEPPRGIVRPRENDEVEGEAEKPKKLARFLKETETPEEPDEDLDEVLKGGDDDDDDDDDDDQQGKDEYAAMLRRQGVNIEGDNVEEEDIYGGD
ncbi:hypothetical protein AC578_8201 [Pseudocercospora eumusae]|uniref:Ubiquitin-like protease family profile domain-containing protein n=1 Tax=Pseudocercospora eumusae TaxID=321146 RepID=A0A139HER5_9PEZI|nr:hypothetical protein AC578_8201 [Pseudocercospora eumusae]